MIPQYPLFHRFGIELEYMIVDARNLRVLPRADRLIKHVTGQVTGDVSRGPLAWSNELALHVIEFKTNEPAASLDPLADRFQSEVAHVNALLGVEGAMLLPTAMHPWMDPHRESRLWTHDCGEIYQAFHRLFNCRGHGWTNLQATHLNLPFANDAEFAQLHTAIRLVLPLLPALAASSPFVDGRRAPFLDMRLDTYRKNCACIPSITGAVVPEPITSRKDYEKKILRRIYRDLKPHDPDGTLQHEWANARGAIARFDRNTVEVRVIDIQECPAADLAIIQCLTAVLKRLTNESLAPMSRQLAPRTADLARLLQRAARIGGAARIESPAILRAFGVSTPRRHWTVRELWQHLLEEVCPPQAAWRNWIELILNEGSLSERILKATGSRPSRDQLCVVYRQIATCLELGMPFQSLAASKPKRAAKPLAVIVSCEHATNRVPKRYREIAGRAGAALESHRGYDPGARELARIMARASKAPLIQGRASRLLVELNRSLGHPQLWSEFSRGLTVKEKGRILETIYLPHRAALQRQILEHLRAGRRVLHIGVHTFTPTLKGRVRAVDIGLLFDPRHAETKRFCLAWHDGLNTLDPTWRVRFNTPYRGISDGLIPHLRYQFPGKDYWGIELEVNQRFVLDDSRKWRQLQRDLAKTLMVAKVRLGGALI